MTSIFNSLGGAISGATAVDLVDPEAASFTATASATLTDVKLGLYLDAALPGASSGTLTVSLYSNSSTAPGTAIATLATIAHPALPTSAGTLDITGFTGVPLTAGTRYWIELTDTSTGVTWTTTQDLSGTGVSGQFVNNSYASLADSAAGAPRMDVTVACFAAGTRLATPHGETAVERLRTGDLLRTHSGRLAPIKWIGRRRIDCRRHPRPEQVRPIAVAPGAFAPFCPSRTVLLSPDHAVFADDALVPIRHLVNGATITRQSVASVTYFHIELDQHDIILAAGLPVESYLDTGNRNAFSNAPGPTALHPDLAPETRSRLARAIWAVRGYAPLLEDGSALAKLRRCLHARALALGHRLATAPMRIRAGGADLTPRPLGAGTYRIDLPPDCHSVSLLSPSARPVETTPDSADHRRLGLMLTSLTLRAPGYRRDLLADIIASGLYPLETAGPRAWRWTNGAAHLSLPTDPPTPRFLDLTVAAQQPCWRLGTDDVEDLAAVLDWPG